MEYNIGSIGVFCQYRFFPAYSFCGKENLHKCLGILQKGYKNMMDVYICESVPEEREMVERYVKAAVLIQEYDMEIKAVTANPQEVINQLKTSKNSGVYFLDLDAEDSSNGLLLAKEIREYDPRGFVIFMTSHPEISYLTFQYKLEVLDFIKKNEPQQLQSRINACLDNVNKKHMHVTRGPGKTITIAVAGRKLTLEYDEIMFFETSANDHKIFVHTEYKRIEFFGKLKEIEREVGDDFIRCHRSYLVNKKNIKEFIYLDKAMIMKNGARCPVSCRMLKRVKGWVW